MNNIERLNKEISDQNKYRNEAEESKKNNILLIKGFSQIGKGFSKISKALKNQLLKHDDVRISAHSERISELLDELKKASSETF